MAQRRFTRLTNAFSKKLENHCAAVALYAAHYNFCRVHEALRITPAMQLGVTDHVIWGGYQGQGENHLGKILMQVRAELQQHSQ